MLFRISSLFFILVICSPSCRAGITTWSVQSASSSLTISAEWRYAGNPLLVFQGQYPFGQSVLTSYGGVIETSQEILDGRIQSLQITSGSLTANNSGGWNPSFNYPVDEFANYGLEAVNPLIGRMLIAIRDLQLSLHSATMASQNPDDFDTFVFLADIETDALSGRIDYAGTDGIADFIGLDSGTLNIVGPFTPLNPSTGSVHLGSTEAVLTIPISIEMLTDATDTADIEDDVSFLWQLNGQIVATASLETVPEMGSLALGLLGIVLTFAARFRSRCGAQ